MTRNLVQCINVDFTTSCIRQRKTFDNDQGINIRIRDYIN